MPAERSIRILRIIARLNIGGPAIQAVSLSSRLSRDSWRNLLVCGNVSPGEGDMSYLATSASVQPKVVPELGRELSPLDDLRALMSLRRIIKDFRPHIIHTHTAKAGALGRLAGMSLNGKGRHDRIRFVHTFHGHVFHGYFGPRKTKAFIRIERFLAKYTDRIVVVSPLQRRDICEKYKVAPPHKTRVIPLGFNLTPFQKVPQHRTGARKHLLGLERDDVLLIGIVGRLTRIKNHRTFLEAARTIRERGKGDVFRFLVIGDGELRQELEACARKLGIDDLVVFAGWRKDMDRVYGALDAIALTSMNEGTPVTLIEAMASGVPVIATEVGGVPDLLGAVKDEAPRGYRVAERGLLLHPGDPVGLAEALIAFSEDRGLFGTMCANAKEYALREYGMERLLENMKVLYSEILQDEIV